VAGFACAKLTLLKARLTKVATKTIVVVLTLSPPTESRP
jgi:hypothetical protein